MSRRLPSSRLSVRRFALLATTAFGLTAGAYFMAPDLFQAGPARAQDLSQEAQRVARPVGFADIVEKVKPAVISVRVKLETSRASDDLPFPKGSPMEQFFRRFGLPNGVPDIPRSRRFATGQGSGFLISSDGYAVTNNHVVDRAMTVEVRFDDGKSRTAKVIGTDPRTDLALIKIEGGGSFPYVKLAEAQPRVGDWVLAVGNPFGLGGTVTAGIVSARGRDIGAGPYDDFLQIDAPVNKGNSGGPTFNTEGSVIGVNTAIFSPSGGSVGIAFAIPAETVKAVVAQLKEHGRVARGWIGVHIQPVTREIADSFGLKTAEGALVAEPQKDSPATKAGIEAGDIITSVDGHAIKDARELTRRIGGMTPGTTINLGILRKGSQQTVTLTLGELPTQEAQIERDLRPYRDRDFRHVPNRNDDKVLPGDRSRRDGGAAEHLGLSLAPNGDEPGLVVAEVDPIGPASDVDIRPGDVVLEVSGIAVASPADVRKALGNARAEGKTNVLLRVKSERGTRFVAVPIGRS
jgi:serine protease Do